MKNVNALINKLKLDKKQKKDFLKFLKDKKEVHSEMARLEWLFEVWNGTEKYWTL